MDELPDLIVCAEREAHRGRLADAVPKILRALVVIVQEIGRMRSRLDTLESEAERNRDPW